MHRRILAAVLVSGSIAAVTAAQTDSSTTQAAQTAQNAAATTSATTTSTTSSTATSGPTPCTNQPMNHKISVTTDGVSCKDAHVSKKQQNTIRWYSPKGTTLSIVWDTEVPFKSVTCKYNGCKAKGVKSLPDGTTLAYETAINGVKTKDPNVIINP